MIALQITSSKDFMGKLLASDMFDLFLMSEAQVVTANGYTIDGRMQKAFFTEEEWSDPEIRAYELAQWKDMKSVIFSMIKGKHTPVRFQIVLQLKPEWKNRILQTAEKNAGENSIEKQETEDSASGIISSLQLNVRYENGQTSLVTAVAYSGFSMDKEPEHKWDGWMKNFLAEKGIAFEE